MQASRGRIKVDDFAWPPLASRVLGIEVALKDTSRFKESWAYFNFIREDGSAAESVKAFPKERCWSCHNEHAATDNVFTQFYPVLRREL